MKPDSLLLLFVIGLLCFASCADSHDKAVRDSIQIMNEMASIKAIESATTLFKLDYGYFPKSLADLTSPTAGMSQDKWRGPYLDKPATQDFWGTDLKYSVSEQENKVSLISAGPDRQFNTTDDIRN